MSKPNKSDSDVTNIIGVLLCDYDLSQTSDEMDSVIEIAVKAVNKLIASKEAEARIDELENMAIHSLNTNYGDISSDIRKRLNQLKGNR
jgi:hypothetical protein